MNELPTIEARVRPYQDPSDRPTKLLALCEIIIAGHFVIKGIRVLRKADGSEEPFVVFPAEKGKGATADRWFDIAHPVTAEARTASVEAVLSKYREVMKTKA